MKRILLTTTLSALALTTAAFAGGPDNMAMPVQASNNHFFIGGAAGMGVLNATQRSSASFTTADGTSDFAINNRVGTASFLGGLLLGYNAYFGKNLYVGVVGNALFNSMNHNITTAGVTFKPADRRGVSSEPTTASLIGAYTLKNSFQGGIDLRLGMEIDHVTPYVSGGFEAGSWKYNTPFASAKKTLVGPQAGLGALFDIAPNWSAGLEYDYTWFGTIHANNAGPIVSAPLGIKAGSAASSVKVAQSQVLASLNYLFN